jgi:hypothetical protein
MKNVFVIQWKNKVNGRAGKGTKQFTLEEAESLARELNEEYPDIAHEPIALSQAHGEPESAVDPYGQAAEEEREVQPIATQ